MARTLGNANYGGAKYLVEKRRNGRKFLRILEGALFPHGLILRLRGKKARDVAKRAVDARIKELGTRTY